MSKNTFTLPENVAWRISPLTPSAKIVPLSARTYTRWASLPYITPAGESHS